MKTFGTIKGFLFDLDGVIVDTAKYHYLAWRSIARELGFEFTPEHNERLKGVSRMQSLEILLEVGGLKLDAVEKEMLASKKNGLYLAYIQKMSPDEILPGARDFLLQSRVEGILTALGSASKNAGFILDRLEIRSLFDAVIDGNIVSEAKPHPEVFLQGAQALGLEARQCIVFEDAMAGVEAAKAAGMKCVGIGEKEVLKGADWIYPGLYAISVQQILAYTSDLKF